MSSSLVRRNADGSERRMLRVFIDSRTVTDHNERSPSEYTVALPEVVENVKLVRLKNYRVAVSAYFVLIRTSRLFDNTGATPVEDSIHVKCKALQGPLSRGTKKDPVMITNSDGTFKLQVQRTIAERFSPDEAEETARDASLFLCTGTFDESSDTTINPNDLTLFDSAESAGISFQSDSTGPFDAADTGTASIFVNTVENDLYLDVSLGGNKLRRLAAPAPTMFPQWESYRFYFQGDIASFKDPVTGVLTNHQALLDHMSTVSDDVTGLLEDRTFAPLTGNQSRVSVVDGAFHVIHPEVTNEHTEQKKFNNTDVAFETGDGITAGEISIGWKTSTGTPLLFPQFSTVVITSMETAPFAYAQRQFQHHNLTLELEFETRSVY